MSAVWLALGASVAWGIADFLGGTTSRRISVFRVLVWSQPAGLVLLVAAFAWRGGDLKIDPSAVVAAATAGATSLAALSLFYFAMAKGRITLVAPIEATGVGVPVVVGIISGDAITMMTATGIVLAIFGMIIVTWGIDKENDKKEDNNLLAAALALGSAVAYGLFLTLLDLASNHDPLAASTIMRFTSSVLIVFAYVAYRYWKHRVRQPLLDTLDDRSLQAVSQGRGFGAKPELIDITETTGSSAIQSSPLSSRNVSTPKGGTTRARNFTMLAIFVIGIADAVAEVSFASASAIGQLSATAVLSSLYPVFTMLLAILILRERVRPVQGIGAACAFGGVLLLAAH